MGVLHMVRLHERVPGEPSPPRMSAHLHENLRSLSKARLDALATFWLRPALAILPGKRECEFGYFRMFIVFALKCLKPFG